MESLLSRRKLIASCAATAALGGVSVWRTQQRYTSTSSVPTVTCTVGMITDVARTIGGDVVNVSGLMGAGVDPHLYKPSAGDIQRLGDADLILYGGLHLEGRMMETFETITRAGTVRTRAVSESIPEDLLLSADADTDARDPHVWFDVSLWNIVAGTITEELVALRPNDAAGIEARSGTYRDRLDQLDAWVMEQIAQIPEGVRVLVTAHDAFTYFGKRYGIEVMGLQGLSSATEAGAADVQDLADVLAERQIPAIFVESSIPPGTIEAVQAATKSRGWDVRIGGQLYSDAMGQRGTPDGTYIGMVRHNVTTIVEALLGEHARS